MYVFLVRCGSVKVLVSKTGHGATWSNPAVRYKKLVCRVHAVQRMFQRHISEEDVRAVVATGEMIRDYPDDTPYPSRLILGWQGDRPLHVVAADNHEAEETIIITVYQPDPDQWEQDFRSKKP